MDENKKDKLQRLLDYNLNLDEPDQRAQIQKLLAEDHEAQKIQNSLRRNLEFLAGLSDEYVQRSKHGIQSPCTD